MTQLLPATAAAPVQRRRRRMLGPAVTFGALSVATVALRLRDPHQQGSWGICPSALLGLWCPGCGGLRAVNDLTHGEVLAAASSNLAFVVALPFIVGGLVLWTIGRWRGRPFPVPWLRTQQVAYLGLAVVLVFTVVRNLPFGGWLAP